MPLSGLDASMLLGFSCKDRDSEHLAGGLLG